MLTVVGVGVRIGQLTIEVQHAIEKADVVFALLASRTSLAMLKSLNQNVEDLQRCYQHGKQRQEIYEGMVSIVLDAVRSGKNVCFAIYGHPCMLVYASREAVRRARDEGYKTSILPGISSQDCLLAELEMDPAAHGLQSYEATVFLQEQPVCNPRAALILWQIGVMGDRTCLPDYQLEMLGELKSQLADLYGPDQPAVIYEAAEIPFLPSVIIERTISTLAREDISQLSTLVIPPLGYTEKDIRLTGSNSQRLHINL